MYQLVKIAAAKCHTLGVTDTQFEPFSHNTPHLTFLTHIFPHSTLDIWYDTAAKTRRISLSPPADNTDRRSRRAHPAVRVWIGEGRVAADASLVGEPSVETSERPADNVLGELRLVPKFSEGPRRVFL